MNKVFIDGSAGTTGLKIAERLSGRTDIELIKLPENLRKNTEAKKEALNSADIVFLCLPDDAAKESVSLITNPDTVVIDTSTAHRTAEGWVYGFAELVGYDSVKNAKRIANPGCHASGYIALIRPLVEAGILKQGASLCCTSITGYSGGGKKMIADYQDADALLGAPRLYALSQQHKHLKEMVKLSCLDTTPAFMPIVSNFYSGMQVIVPVFKSDLNGGIDDIKTVYKQKYTGDVVVYSENADESGFMSSAKLSTLDKMEISVQGNDERILLVARYDNLGKGASGAAIQNMNIVLGANECEGLLL